MRRQDVSGMEDVSRKNAVFTMYVNISPLNLHARFLRAGIPSNYEVEKTNQWKQRQKKGLCSVLQPDFGLLNQILTPPHGLTGKSCQLVTLAKRYRYLTRRHGHRSIRKIPALR